MVAIGFAVGFRIHTGPLPFLGGMVLVLAFAYSMSWVFATVGLLVGDPETGLDPYRLDDAALERELRHLYVTREETFLHGTRQALLNHTERMLQLEREYASRFPERTKADTLRTRKGSLIQAGQPAGRSTIGSDHHPGPAWRTRGLMEWQRS